jgi:hypothetical protein
MNETTSQNTISSPLPQQQPVTPAHETIPTGPFPTTSTKTGKPLGKQIAGFIKNLILLAAIAAILFGIYIIYDAMQNQIKLETRNNPAACQYDNCINFPATYENGTSTWVLHQFLPLKLQVTGQTFTQNDIPVTIRCEVKKYDNDYVTKGLFVVGMDVDLQKCNISSR